jgi:hypothetical protein
MPRYWSITQSTTGNFDPSASSGQGRIAPSHWEGFGSLDFFVPVIYAVSWCSTSNAGYVQLYFVADAPEYGSSAVNRIVLFEDASGLISNFQYTNYGRGRRIPFVGSRGTRYSLELLTRGVLGPATWTVELGWEPAGVDPQCPPTTPNPTPSRL